jgi:hypothetical protein
MSAASSSRVVSANTHQETKLFSDAAAPEVAAVGSPLRSDLRAPLNSRDGPVEKRPAVGGSFIKAGTLEEAEPHRRQPRPMGLVIWTENPQRTWFYGTRLKSSLTIFARSSTQSGLKATRAPSC